MAQAPEQFDPWAEDLSPSQRQQEILVRNTFIHWLGENEVDDQSDAEDGLYHASNVADGGGEATPQSQEAIRWEKVELWKWAFSSAEEKSDSELPPEPPGVLLKGERCRPRAPPVAPPGLDAPIRPPGVLTPGQNAASSGSTPPGVFCNTSALDVSASNGPPGLLLAEQAHQDIEANMEEDEEEDRETALVAPITPPGVLLAEQAALMSSAGGLPPGVFHSETTVREETPAPDSSSGPPGVLVAQRSDHGSSVGPPPGTFLVTPSADEMSHPSTSGPPGVLLAKPKAVHGYPHDSVEHISSSSTARPVGLPPGIFHGKCADHDAQPLRIPPGILVRDESAATCDDTGTPSLHATLDQFGLPAARVEEGSLLSLENALANTVLDIEFVDTIERCEEICIELLQPDAYPELAVDLEGIELCRHGKLCILQIAVRDGRTFLFDIVTLGKDAFTHGLKRVLEAESVAKLLFDCRCDADALYHQFEITLRNVLDVQVLWHKFDGGTDNYLSGMKKLLQKVLPKEEFERAAVIKTHGRKLYESDLGGSPDIWERRPLHPVLQTYCALDVKHLFKMLDLWGDCLSRQNLKATSERRAVTQVQMAIFVKGPHRALKDFELVDRPEVSAVESLRPVSIGLPHAPPLHGSDGSPVRSPTEFTRVGADLRRAVSRNSGAQRIFWTLNSTTLRSSHAQQVSPAFDLEIHGLLIQFKLFLQAAVAQVSSKFKHSNGLGIIKLKCMVESNSVPGELVRFRFFVGKEPRRGTVEHDFKRSAICTCAEVWNLADAVHDGRFVIGVELMT